MGVFLLCHVEPPNLTFTSVSDLFQFITEVIMKICLMKIGKKKKFISKF